MDGWVDGWVDEWMDGWVDGWVDGWMGGWVDYRGRYFAIGFPKEPMLDAFLTFLVVGVNILLKEGCSVSGHVNNSPPSVQTSRAERHIRMTLSCS